MTRYDYEDYDDQLMLASVRTSRKRRICRTCGGEIRPGDRYRRVFFPQADRGACTHVMHASAGECMAVMAAAEARMARHWLPGQAVLNPEMLTVFGGQL